MLLFWKWYKCLGTSYAAQCDLYLFISFAFELGTAIISFPSFFNTLFIVENKLSKSATCSNTCYIITLSKAFSLSSISLILSFNSIPLEVFALSLALALGSIPTASQPLFLHLFSRNPVPEPISNRRPFSLPSMFTFLFVFSLLIMWYHLLINPFLVWL